MKLLRSHKKEMRMETSGRLCSRGVPDQDFQNPAGTGLHRFFPGIGLDYRLENAMTSLLYQADFHFLLLRSVLANRNFRTS